MGLDGIQKFVEITLTCIDLRKSVICGPWISLDLGIIQIYNMKYYI